VNRPHTSRTAASPPETTDIAIVGAGAAGLMAAIWAGRTARAAGLPLRLVALDGASRLGAKILVAGGGRCNVTHDAVDASVFAGGSRHAIGRVLRQFDIPATIAFFEQIGVVLKREPTGKLFPVTDSARTVLDALLHAARDAGAQLVHPARVDAIERTTDGFRLRGTWGAMRAQRVILATGGRSLPKSGSDGGGYRLAQALGHTLTEPIFPALVPLLLPRDHWLTELSGVSFEAAFTVRSSTGKHGTTLAGSALCTHFGLSGPAVLDISRYYTAARHADAGTTLVMHVLPGQHAETLDADLQRASTSALRHFAGALPERLLRALCAAAQVDAAQPLSQLTRVQRRALVAALTELPLPVVGDRGYTYAEVTAGGVPLHEIRIDSMASRACEGLYLCGEICDVDGRIGGYNFQWAWSSGYVAGRAAVLALAGQHA
jgi:hypothetical protein